MSLRIIELFGYSSADSSDPASSHRADLRCPFILDRCTKTLSDGVVSGVCTVKQVNSGPIICCPVRLYAADYKILLDIATECFGHGVRLVAGGASLDQVRDGKAVAVFGKRWGRELHLPQRGGIGSYFVDWVLAHLATDGTLREFVAVEVQTIDTTGNYRRERQAHMDGVAFAGNSNGGINWENVSKRILPQLIYKGHVLRRERLCSKGLFFICPTPIYERILRRLGGGLLDYTPQPGALTFRHYDLGPDLGQAAIRDLVFKGQMTTTVDQVASALSAPTNLPAAGVYQQAIEAELGS
jgi:hypothetical protein